MDQQNTSLDELESNNHLLSQANDSTSTPRLNDSSLLNMTSPSLQRFTLGSPFGKFEGKEDEEKDEKIKKLEGTYESVRSVPLRKLIDNKNFDSKKKVDRLIEQFIPEFHLVGQVLSGKNLLNSREEGAICRWNIEVGKTWQHLGGDLIGQTHVAYTRGEEDEDEVIFSHPLDVHFALSGLQVSLLFLSFSFSFFFFIFPMFFFFFISNIYSISFFQKGWGAPRITLQSFRLDAFGRRILGGYGFIHIPMTPGFHRLEVPLWRPLGNTEMELKSFLLGETPSLLHGETIYESAWRDRCRLLTTSSGKVTIEFFVVTRYFEEQGILQN